LSCDSRSNDAAIFAQVTGALDSLGGTAGSDQSLITLQSQLEALEKLNNSTQVEIDTSAQELQELTNLASAVGLVQVDLASQRTNAEALAREQIDELRTVVEQQKAQIAQQAEIARQLLEQLKKLNETTEQGVNADELEAARP
jgi:chromosome segregation ATPase